MIGDRQALSAQWFHFFSFHRVWHWPKVGLHLTDRHKHTYITIRGTCEQTTYSTQNTPKRAADKSSRIHQINHLKRSQSLTKPPRSYGRDAVCYINPRFAFGANDTFINTHRDIAAERERERGRPDQCPQDVIYICTEWIWTIFCRALHWIDAYKYSVDVLTNKSFSNNNKTTIIYLSQSFFIERTLLIHLISHDFPVNCLRWHSVGRRLVERK